MMTLREWCSTALIASFPSEQHDEVWQAVLRYLDWLSTLPVTTRRDRVD